MDRDLVAASRGTSSDSLAAASVMLQSSSSDGRFWLSSDNAGLLLTPETEAETPTASIFHQANLLCPGRRLTPYALDMPGLTSQATQLLWFLLNFCHSHPQRQSANGPRLGHYAMLWSDFSLQQVLAGFCFFEDA